MDFLDIISFVSHVIPAPLPQPFPGGIFFSPWRFSNIYWRAHLVAFFIIFIYRQQGLYWLVDNRLFNHSFPDYQLVTYLDPLFSSPVLPFCTVLLSKSKHCFSPTQSFPLSYPISLFQRRQQRPGGLLYQKKPTLKIWVFSFFLFFSYHEKRPSFVHGIERWWRTFFFLYALIPEEEEWKKRGYSGWHVSFFLGGVESQQDDEDETFRGDEWILPECQ